MKRKFVDLILLRAIRCFQCLRQGKEGKAVGQAKQFIFIDAAKVFFFTSSDSFKFSRDERYIIKIRDSFSHGPSKTPKGHNALHN